MPDFSTLFLIGMSVAVVITAAGESLVNRFLSAKKPHEVAPSRGKQNQ